ncbi:hypothetical protein [Bacillus cereus]|uniref:hypothetical protein n=1 Tax=Bacillus cereus TaxID=1396 RepID=UPI000BF356D6|nr:hypothetical protein [Bacillus cereus]PEY56578.1 hypothetical protein CN356_30540 [Bacillus cereus]PFT29625.1 hypothetical protein COK61_13330 [Bacillus cereus]
MGVFKIAHFYNKEHDVQSFFVRTNIDNFTLGEIIACIQFKFEELVDESRCIDEKHLLELLIKYYEIEDVTNEFRLFLPYTQLEDSEWNAVNLFAIYNTYDKIKDLRNTPINERELYIVQIDQHYMRELCCGPDVDKLMKQRLPDREDFEEAIASFK